MSPRQGATAATTPASPPASLQIRILYVPDCPHVGRVRAEVRAAIASTGAKTVIEEIAGPCRSPTVLIDGVDVTGQSVIAEPACRLHLPTAAQIAGAIRAARAGDAEIVTIWTHPA